MIESAQEPSNDDLMEVEEPEQPMVVQHNDNDINRITILRNIIKILYCLLLIVKLS